MRSWEEDIELELQRLRSRMAEMMETLFSRGRLSLVRGRHFKPAMDIYETNSAVIIVMEIAGAERQDIEVQLEGRHLRVAGVRRVAAPPDAQRCHQMEIDFGSFERWITLDFSPPQDGLEAVYQDGFLRITLPKGGHPGDTKVRIDTDESPTPGR